MDLTWSNEAEQFRVRLRNWLDANLSADWHARCRSLDSYIEFQRDWDHKLAAAGLSGILGASVDAADMADSHVARQSSSDDGQRGRGTHRRRCS